MVVGKLKVEFVERPPRLPVDRESDVVEVYVDACGMRIDVCIWRQGLITDPVLRSIRERIRRLVAITAGIHSLRNFLVSLAIIPLMWGGVLVGQTGMLTRLARITVSITPSEVTLFAGESHGFVATATGAEDRSVIWAVDEENGGTITNLGLYTAPSIQGVYHITATSKANSQRKAVATVTVLTYCDPPLTTLRR